jgi:hypothetical protein
VLALADPRVATQEKELSRAANRRRQIFAFPMVTPTKKKKKKDHRGFITRSFY